MNPLKKAMAHASSGMNAQAFRLRVVSENISNADTHGYKKKLLNFKTEYDREKNLQMVTPGRIRLDRADGEQLFDPAHPFADENGYVEMSNVDLLTELADSREAGRSYEANLSAFQQARSMYSNLLELLRR